jgi:ribose transport system substrate-binding protein
MARRLIAAAAMMAFVASACSSSAATTAPTAAPTAAPTTAASTAASAAPSAAANKVVGYSNQAATFPFPGAIQNGIQDTAKQLGYTVVATDANQKSDKQVTDVNDLISQKPAAIILTPVDGTQAMGIVDNIAAAKIPVFVAHGNIGPAGHDINQVYKGVALQITEDDILAGKNAAKIAIAAFPTGAKYAIVEGQAGYVEVTLRAQGFEDGLKASGQTWTKVASQPGDWVPDKGKVACQNMLQANPDIQLFYAESDDMGTGCYEAIQAAGSKAQVIGIGGAKLGIDAINAGKLLGTVCYKPYTEGQLIMKAVDDYLTGAKTYSGTMLAYDIPGVTKANISDCTPQW